MLGEIRRTKRSGLYGGLAAAAGCLVAWIIFGREGMTFAVGAVFFAMYGVLTDRNDRLAYDDQGIILYTVWGKEIAYDWSRIVMVDTAVEQLPERRYNVGLVLRICVKERNGEMTTYRFPYKHYTGLNEFLAFSNCRGKNKDRPTSTRI